MICPQYQLLWAASCAGGSIQTQQGRPAIWTLGFCKACSARLARSTSCCYTRRTGTDHFHQDFQLKTKTNPRINRYQAGWRPGGQKTTLWWRRRKEPALVTSAADGGDLRAPPHPAPTGGHQPRGEHQRPLQAAPCLGWLPVVRYSSAVAKKAEGAWGSTALLGCSSGRNTSFPRL